MTDTDPLAPIEALADNWLAAGDAEGATAADDRVITALVGAGHQLLAALAEARQAMNALGHDDRCESEYVTGASTWSPCGCWASRSEAEGLVRRAEKAEAERDAAREALARVEAAADEIERTANECERLSHVRAGLSDEADLRTAALVNRKRAEQIRAALAQPATRHELARVIWETSRGDEGTISATGANIVADAILAAGWRRR